MLRLAARIQVDDYAVLARFKVLRRVVERDMSVFTDIYNAYVDGRFLNPHAYVGDIRRQAAFAVYIHRYLQIACLRRKTLLQVFAEAGSVAFGQIDVNYSICSSKCESQ